MNVVEFVLKVKDLLSPAVISAAAHANSALNTVANSAVGAQSKLNNAASSVKNLTSQFRILGALPNGGAPAFPSAPLTRYGRDFTNMQTRVTGGMRGIVQFIDRGITGMRNFGTSVANMASRSVTAVGTVTAAMFKKRNVMNQARGALNDLMGSSMIMDTVQNALGISTGVWTAAQEALNLVMTANPIGIVVVAIAGLALWIKHLTNHNKYWAQSLKDLWTVIKAWASNVAIQFKFVGTEIWYWIEYAWLKLKSFVQYSQEAFGKIGRSWAQVKEGDFSGAKETLTAEIKTTAGAQADALAKSREAERMKMIGESNKNNIAIVKGMNSFGQNLKIGWEKRNEAGTDPTKTAAANSAAIAKQKKEKEAKQSLGLGENKKRGMALSPRQNEDLNARSNTITSGGGKYLVINVAELGNNLTINSEKVEKGVDEIVKLVQERWLRMLGSAAHAAF